MASNVVPIQIVVDTSPLTAGMAQAQATVQGASAEMAAAFERNMLSSREQAHLVTEELGLHMPRALRSLVSELGPVQAALNATFGLFAAAGVVEVVGLITEKITDWVANTFILDAATKAWYESEVKINKEIADIADKTRKIEQDTQLIGLDEASRFEVLLARKSVEEQQDKAHLAELRAKLAVEQQISQETERQLIGKNRIITVATEEAKQAAARIPKLQDEIVVLTAKLNEDSAAAQNLSAHFDDAFGREKLEAARKLAEEHQKALEQFKRNAEEARHAWEEQERAMARATLERIKQFETLEKEAERVAAETNRAMLKDAQALEKSIEDLQQQAQKKALAGSLQIELIHKQMAEHLRQTFSGIESSFASSIAGMIKGTETLQQAVARIADAVIGMFAQMAARMAFQWLESHLMMHFVTSSQNTAQVQSEAGLAAATAYAAYAYFPPLADAMAAEAFASTEAWGAVAAFAQGGIVPRDMLAFVHQNEIVLPAPIAKPFIDGAAAGARSGDVHLHVHANDAASVEQWFQRNRNVLVRTLKSAARDGAF